MRQRLTREETQQRTRQLLLQAAQSIFAQKGFAGASVDDVAAAAGFTKGAVYANFATKDELFLALFDQQLEALGVLWETAFDAPTGTADQPQPEQVFASQIGSDPLQTMLALEFFLYALRNEHARPLLAQRYAAARQGVRATIAQLAERGVAPLFSADELAWAIPALSIGLDMQLLADPDRATSAPTALLMRLLLLDAAEPQR